jgi:hypothetical protein
MMILDRFSSAAFPVARLGEASARGETALRPAAPALPGGRRTGCALHCALHCLGHIFAAFCGAMLVSAPRGELVPIFLCAFS